MTLPRVNVFPLPVIPRSTEWGWPSPISETSRSMARGWSPAGANSEDSLNNASGCGRNRHQVLSPRVEERRGVRMPQEVHGEEELRVHRLTDEPETRLLERTVALEEVASQARGHHVGPRGLATTRSRNHVVDGQLLASSTAVLAGVAVAAQDILLVEGHTLQDRLANVDGEPDDSRQVEAPRRGPDDSRRRLDAFGLTAQQQRDGTFRVREVQRLIGVIQHQHRDFIHIPGLG